MIFTKERFVKCEPAGIHDHVITCRTEPTWLGKLFGFKESTEKYRGSCTVWYRVSDGRRCSTTKESWFSEIWTVKNW